MPENLSAYIGVIVTIVWFVGILVWAFRRKYGRTRTVFATVVNKQISESVSKHSGKAMAKRYYVTFQAEGKRRSFSVSELSYNGYRIGERGILKYKSDRLIDFH